MEIIPFDKRIGFIWYNGELSEIGKNGTKWIINNRKWDTIAENYINIF